MNSTLDGKPVDGASAGAPTDAAGHAESEMLDLARPECLRLLASTNFGRIAINGSTAPVIRPVNYVFDVPSQSVIFRSGLGSKLHALIKSATAAFEIDGTDPTSRLGWSVIILGVTEEVTSASEVRRLEGIGVEPWAPGVKAYWVRIRANTVSGRRIVMVGNGISDYRQ